MIILGWISTAFGALLSFCGIMCYNEESSNSYGLYKYYDSSGVDAARVVILIGALLFVLGLVLLIIGYLKKPRTINGYGSQWQNNPLQSRQCVKCKTISRSEEHFCRICGNDLMNQYKQ